MSSWGERFNKMLGRNRIVVCRLFIHLAGKEVTPLLGVLNRAARKAIDAEGDMNVMGELLAEICQNLLQLDTYWRSAANEGDFFTDEGEASDYYNSLFTDSASRYLSEPDCSENYSSDETLSLPITENLVVMITVAFEGKEPALETDLSQFDSLTAGLKALINLHYKGRLRAVSIHFSPAQLGEQLTEEQLLQNFPELIPL
ncbi:MAG: DUF1517 domain-containing protein [Oscillatoriaceae bacterium SKW80]|nr:DUF1517 domain-containing protein [Oscillatoriaceae bacterium SKYG93]MCX8120344.1 DUF1517 domain-containing protein [Oscillatoriaceae bacterium SKW80]MDW8453270.1 DUF1517 domain-containing protein [Oscillatoriaceae cyanobacterium SKYGB_i_bin93]HIK27287.1 DUF1517 domain-containing protein [Oscillatoriaceae cyanobacterium M7585_C2015_266]